ncbi:MAG TPA: hypothetical protein VGA61_16500, partial [Anaerolineae bacterium]
QQLTDYLKELVPGFGQGVPGGGKPAPAPSPRRVLPTHCPGCGAPLRPDEVDWLDEMTATCEYCGSPVHGES